jgi:hypothetical protein
MRMRYQTSAFPGTFGVGSRFWQAYAADRRLPSEPKMKLFALVIALFICLAAPDAQAQQCLVTGPTCSDAKAQCRQIRKRAFPGKSNNPCANRFRRCMAEGRYVSRNCNVPMQKS